MKRLFFAVIIIMLTIPIWAFEVDGICYKVTSVYSKTVEITKTNTKVGAYSGDVQIPYVVLYEGNTYFVTSIGAYSFSGCSGLTSVTIPNSVTSIGRNAFSGCSGLSTLVIGNSVTKIENFAFKGCNGLITIVVESDNPMYDSRDNSNSIIETATNTLIAGCKNTIIPNTVKKIAAGAFSGCSSLTSLTIPNSVTSIGENAFAGCAGITSVIVPNSVESIGEGAFTGCNKLPSEINSIQFRGIFVTPSEIKQYFIDNIEKLDPLEGEYDVQSSIRSNSILIRNISNESTFYIVKDSCSGQYKIYDKGFYCSNNRIEPVGETNTYRFYWNNSTNRVIFDSDIHLSTQIELLPSDAKELCGSSEAEIVMGYDLVKKYPTSSMCMNAKSGTGFVLSSSGYVITNQHVIEGAKSIKVTNVNGNGNVSLSAKVEVSDKQNDLAIIRIIDNFTSPTIPYTIKFSQSNVGENCWVLGYPLTQSMGNEIKLTNGIISSKSGFDGNIAQYQISAPVQPGNSGGPVFDKSGNLIGVVQAKHGLAENASYAIKAGYIRNLIEMLPDTISLPQTNLLAGKSLPDQVDLASKCVVLIKCE